MALTDVFRPKWKHSSAAIRLEAVKWLTDDRILEQIASNDPNPDVLRLARQKGLLRRLIELSCKHCKSEFQALGLYDSLGGKYVKRSDTHHLKGVRLTGNEVLMEDGTLAHWTFDNAGSYGIRITYHDIPLANLSSEKAIYYVHTIASAVDGTFMKVLPDAEIVTEIIRDTSMPSSARVAGIENPVCTDQSLLADLARHDGDRAVRVAAAVKVDDKDLQAAVLLEIGKDDFRATWHINDERVLAEIIKTMDDHRVCEVAFKKLQEVGSEYLADEALLEKAAMVIRVYPVAESAAKMLADQTRLARIARSANSFARAGATRKLNDQTLLAELAISPGDYAQDVRDAAIETLKDQEKLAHVAQSVNFLGGGRKAIGRITDVRVLKELAANASCLDVRNEASDRLQQL